MGDKDYLQIAAKEKDGISWSEAERVREINIADMELIPEEAYISELAYFNDAHEQEELLAEEYSEQDQKRTEEKPASKKEIKKAAKSVPPNSRQAMTLEPFWVVPNGIRGTLLGKLALSISEAYEFPEFSCLATLLGSASAAVSCNYATAYSNGNRLNTGLYVVVEQPPATGKSRLLDIFMKEYGKAMSAHNRRVAMKNREIAERNIETPTMPASFVNTTEPTSAAMDGAMAKMADGRFVVASSEQSAFTMLFPQGKSFSSTNELLLKGWPGEQTEIMRGSRQSFCGVACGSIALIAQQGSGRTVLGESGGTGLAERFLFVAEPSLLGHRELLGNEPDASLMLSAKNAINRCVSLYSERVFERWTAGVYEQITPDDIGMVQPTPEGYKFLLELKQKNEPLLGQLQDSGHLVAVGWLGKADTHILKIATILHVFECLGAGSNVPQRIPMKLIEIATEFVLSLFEYFTGLLSDNGESGVSTEEDAVIDSLIKPMARRQLVLKLKNRSPFRGLGKNAYAAANRRLDRMLEQGSIVVLASGKLEVV